MGTLEKTVSEGMCGSRGARKNTLVEIFTPRRRWYLWVSRGSMLHIEGQCLGTATLPDQVSRIQSHVLVQNLVVLFGGGGIVGKNLESVRPVVRVGW
jgi:hypothetical protein